VGTDFAKTETRLQNLQEKRDAIAKEGETDFASDIRLDRDANPWEVIGGMKFDTKLRADYPIAYINKNTNGVWTETGYSEDKKEAYLTWTSLPLYAVMGLHGNLTVYCLKTDIHRTTLEPIDKEIRKLTSKKK